MTPGKIPSNDSKGGASRRTLLQTLIAAPISMPTIAAPWAKALSGLEERYADDAALLCRSREGRKLSRCRYQSAEIAFMGIETGFFNEPRFIRATLHQAGSVAKLALCAYLLDIGFPDTWAARHIQQDITKALAYANASGFGHDCPNMERLATILSPFWKWGYPQMIGDPPIHDGGFTPDEVRCLVRALLDRVSEVTGHPRPRTGRRPRLYSELSQSVRPIERL